MTGTSSELGGGSGREKLPESREPVGPAPESGASRREKLDRLLRACLKRVQGTPGSDDEREALVVAVREAVRQRRKELRGKNTRAIKEWLFQLVQTTIDELAANRRSPVTESPACAQPEAEAAGTNGGSPVLTPREQTDGAETIGRVRAFIGELLREYSGPLAAGSTDEEPADGSLCDYSVSFTRGPDGVFTHWESGAAFAWSDRNDRPEEGTVLGDKWRLLQLKNSDSTFGYFFLGEHAFLKSRVGVKVLRGRFTATERGRKQFHKEAMSVSLLSHPSIVKVFDYGEEDQRPYLVMEYLSGTPLTDYFGDGELELEDVVDVLAQVSEALVHAHGSAEARGPLVHLDLKPDHVFLERVGDRWHVKVIDFGIAEIVSAPGGDTADRLNAGEDVPPRITGTLPYMAPERFDGVVDPRSDLYSLGIVLYEFVTGRRPFEVPDFQEMERLHRVVTPDPPSLRARKPWAGLPGIDRIVAKLLAKDLASRPANAGELLAELRAWQEQRAEARRRPSWSQRLKRASAVLGAILLPAFGVLWWGPFERLPVPDEGVPKVLRGGPGRSFTTVLSGIGYRRGEVFLEVEDTAGSRPPGRVLVSTVGDLGRIDGTWPAGDRVLGTRDGSSSLRGRVVAVGWFGREVASAWFPLRVDLQPPQLRSLALDDDARDSLVEIDPASRRLYVRQDKRRLVVRADETLDVGRCRWAGRSVGAFGDDEEPAAVVVDVVESDERPPECELVLVDLAGNSIAVPFEVRFVERPRILSPDQATIRTNAEDYALAVRIDYAGATDRRVDVILDDAVVPAYSGELPETSVPMGFAAARGSTRTATVLVWVPPPYKNDAPPDAEGRFRVDFDARRLSIEHVPDDDPDALPRFRVVDADGEVVDVEGIEIELLRVGPGEARTRIEGAKLDPETGELRCAAPLKGNYLLRMEAKDEFGNQTVKVYAFSHPAPPEILTIRPVGADGAAALGTRGNPYYIVVNTDLRSHPAPVEAQHSTFRCRLRYRDLSDLAWTVDLGGTRWRVDGVPMGADEYEVTIPTATILEHLAEGENPLTLRVEDPVSGDVERFAASGTCTLYRSALALRLHPEVLRVSSLPLDFTLEYAGPVRRQSLSIRVEPHGVTVEDMPGSRGREHTWRLGGFPLAGATTVEISFETADHRTHTLSREYSRLPISGHRYVFTLPDLADVELVYVDDGKGHRFWCGDPEGGAVSLETAMRRCRDLSSKLRESCSALSVALPSVAELGALSTAHDRPPSEGETEWVSDLPDDPATFGASFVEHRKAGAPVRFDGFVTEKHRFRIVFKDEQLELLDPRNARSVGP